MAVHNRPARRTSRMLAAGVALAASVGAAVSTGPADAVVPGTNGLIAFASTRDGSLAEIYVMNPGGTSQTRLTTNSIVDTDPAFSPDGSKIVYRSGGDIWRMNTDGTGKTQLTTLGLSSAPSYTSDGLKIAFTSANDVWIMNADGTSPVNLTNSPGVQDSSTYVCGTSTDGTIVFNSNRDDVAAGPVGTEIYTVKVDGTSPTRLTPVDGLIDSAPHWSPDCQKIVWNNALFVEGTPFGQFDLFTMNADGTSPVNLTNNPEFDSFGAFSPDNTRIVWTSFRDQDQELYSMNASDGGSQVRLTNITGADVRPDWGTAALLPVNPGPATKDACKNGNWKQFTDPAFKNQGDCVSYYNWTLHNSDTTS